MTPTRTAHHIEPSSPEEPESGLPPVQRARGQPPAIDVELASSSLSMPALVSVSEAAEELSVSRQSILKSMKTAKLPATRVVDTWAVRKSVVQARVRENAERA